MYPRQVGQPETGFENPLNMMSDFHRRIELYLDELLAIARRNSDGILARSDHAPLDLALGYLDLSAPLHHADEDASLFPRLRGSRSPRVAHTMTALDSLQQDHESAETAHEEIDLLGRKWLAMGRLSAAEIRLFTEILEDMRALYHRHIATEDNEIFPVAAEELDPADILAIGREMARRRGLDPESLPVLREHTEAGNA